MRSGLVVLACASLGAACGTLVGVAADRADGGSSDATVRDGTRFCDRHADALACSDFDDPDAAAFAIGWEVQLVAGDGADAAAALASVDDTSAQSSPRVLRSATSAPASWSNQGPAARLTHQLDPFPGRRVRITFDVLVEAAGPTDETSVAEIFWDSCPVAVYDGVWVFLKQSAMELAANGKTVDGGSVAISAGWHHVVLEGDWSTPTATLDVDGTVRSAPISPPCAGAGRPRVNVGSSLQTGGATTLRYDDVLVEVEP